VRVRVRVYQDVSPRLGRTVCRGTTCPMLCFGQLSVCACVLRVRVCVCVCVCDDDDVFYLFLQKQKSAKNNIPQGYFPPYEAV
jgi:hypothetical protein